MRSRAIALTAASMAVLALAGSGCKIETSNRGNGAEAPAKSVLDTSKIQQDWGGREIKPTGIVLHWWGNDGSGGIDGLINGLNSVPTTFDRSLTSTQPHPKNGHTSVQIGVDMGGKAYQLTPKVHNFARHATCANPDGIGIEIAGSDGGKTGPYIGDNDRQFKTVVAVIKELMAKYDIPAVNEVGPRAHSIRGIVSHHQVDAVCTWKDGVKFNSGKTDVGDKYLKRVLAAVGG